MKGKERNKEREEESKAEDMNVDVCIGGFWRSGNEELKIDMISVWNCQRIN